MTWREKALAVIHLEFERYRKHHPHLSVTQIMIQIKIPSDTRFPAQVWRDAKSDYQRDAQKMYEQKGSKN